MIRHHARGVRLTLGSSYKFDIMSKFVEILPCPGIGRSPQLTKEGKRHVLVNALKRVWRGHVCKVAFFRMQR